MSEPNLSETVARAKEITTISELEAWTETAVSETDTSLRKRRGVIGVIAADRLLKESTDPEQRTAIHTLKLKIGAEVFQVGYGPGLTPPLGS